uniref:Uncharacterized protein n=1 Tax=Chenopodium quinoa TaxID=63459 RepID=A0A803KPZ2_CHEQI
MTSNKKDEELRQAAVRGDVDYLTKCVESNRPVEYIMTFFPEEDDHSERRHWGNIFHMAAKENQEEFIREAIGILPPEAMQQLLLQPGEDERNPLHDAAKVGNVEITSFGANPCLVAVVNGFEERALEIFKMDTELISNMPSGLGSSLVFDAIFTKMSKLALQILRSPHPISCSGSDHGNTPFDIIHYIEDLEGSEEIFSQLLQRDPELIKHKDINGGSAFHTWACYGKMWPYKILLECNDIIPDVNKVFTDLVSSTTFSCDNPLHFLAYGPCDEDAKQIAEMLIVIESEKNVMFLAVENECHAVAEEILTIIDNKGWTQLLTNHRNLTVLHLAPLCTENNCSKVAQVILENLDKGSRAEYLKNYSDGRNILHLATNLADETFGTLLVNEAPEFITQKDNSEQSALDKAYELGSAWFIKAVLGKDSSVFNSEPLAWIKAYYEKFLKIPRMKDLINLQDSTGATPLHKAIQNEDLFLTETLLSFDKIIYDIKNDEDNSAIDLLAQKCEDNQQCPWV